MFRTVPLIKVGVGPPSPSGDGQEYLQHVSLVPGGGLLIVKDNDIFYKPSEQSDKVTRVTNTGVPGIDL